MTHEQTIKRYEMVGSGWPMGWSGVVPRKSTDLPVSQTEFELFSKIRTSETYSRICQAE